MTSAPFVLGIKGKDYQNSEYDDFQTIFIQSDSHLEIIMIRADHALPWFGFI